MTVIKGVKGIVAISFTKFREKIEKGTKKQTTRPFSPVRWTQLRAAEKYQLFWKQRTKECESLGEVEPDGKPFSISFEPLSGSEYLAWKFGDSGCPEFLSPEEMEDLAKRDGFDTFKEYITGLQKINEKRNKRDSIQSYIVVRWK